MSKLALADGQPYLGQTIAAMDESAREAGPGVYYVLSTVLISAPAAVAQLARAVIGERQRPFHYSQEGPETIERMLLLIEAEALIATCLWCSVGRKGQTDARSILLQQQARMCADIGVDHLIIESGDKATNQRDQSVLLDTFRGAGNAPFQYDWRSKSEPLLWLADAVCAIASESLLGHRMEYYERFEAAGLIEVIASDMRQPRLPS